MMSTPRTMIALAAFRPLASALVGLLSAGCLLPGAGLSARPIGAGQTAVGAAVSVTAYNYVDNNGSLEQIRLASPMPEVSLRRGVNDDVDIGGRLALGQLAFGAHIRYRFLRRGPVHLAVTPELDIQNLRIMNGIRARMPIVASVEVSDRLALSGALFALGGRYTTPDPEDAGSEFGVFQGPTLALGGGLAVDIRAGRWLLRPGVEVARYALGSADAGFAPFTAVHGIVQVQTAM